MKAGLTLVLPLILPLVVSCASSLTVDQSLVDAFPAEGRRWTYSAENEVIIGLDRLDDMRDRQRELVLKLSTPTAGGQAAKVHQARHDWLGASLEHATAAVEAAEIFVGCSKAALELTKARAAVRFDLPVEEGFVEAFDERYKACAGRLELAQRRTIELSDSVRAARRKWLDVRTEYVKGTGDHDHGLWID